MELKELMDGFAAEAGLDALTADDTGVYWLKIDSFSIGFATDETERMLIVYTPIAAREEASAGDLAEVLLELNNLYIGSFGGTVALDREAGLYLYQRREALADFGKETFPSLLEDFVNRAETLQGLIEGFAQTREAAEKIAETKAEEDRSIGGLSSGFMQV